MRQLTLTNAKTTKLKIGICYKKANHKITINFNINNNKNLQIYFIEFVLI